MSSKPGKSSGKSWAICFGIGCVLAVLMLCTRGGLDAADARTFLHVLCDALFVPGALLTCSGLLSVVAGEGAFAAIHYGLQKLFSMLRNEKNRSALPKTYYDFYQQRYSKKTPPPVALLVSGVCFLAAACVILILYNGAA